MVYALATVERPKDRKKVEMLSAHLKRILKLDRLRLRGPSGARDEFPTRSHRTKLTTNGEAADVCCTGSGTDRRIKQHQGPVYFLDNQQSVTETRDLQSQAVEPRPNLEYFNGIGRSAKFATDRFWRLGRRRSHLSAGCRSVLRELATV